MQTALTTIFPKAVAWAEAQAMLIAQVGSPLDESMLVVARSMGVLHPERIRIVDVPSIPMPEDLELRHVALSTGLLNPNIAGLTLGYGIYISHEHQRNVRLLSHEFRHVYQYEMAGSIAAFLQEYLRQVTTVGYRDAAFEVDARAHEIAA